MKFKNISNQVNFPEMEKEILKFWESNDTFKKSLDQRKDGEEFVFYDGPPFATGLPHYGHLLAGTTLSEVMALIFSKTCYFTTGKEPGEIFVISDLLQSFSTKAGTPLLLWSMLLAVFPLAVYLCRTAYERFSMYCMTIFIFIFSDLFRYLLLVNIPGNHAVLISFWVSLIAGVGAVGGILYAGNRLLKGEEKK